jgi:hypothetical protein
LVAPAPGRLAFAAGTGAVEEAVAAQSVWAL